MLERLLDPDRLVYLKRKLRYPVNEITYESIRYGLALLLFTEIFKEENTASAWIIELDSEKI